MSATDNAEPMWPTLARFACSMMMRLIATDVKEGVFIACLTVSQRCHWVYGTNPERLQ
jgi:hypothetical protein